MNYLILDKRQRVETKGKYSYVLTRLIEEMEAMGISYTIAYNEEIEIEMTGEGTKIYVQGVPIENFSHIFFRGMRLDKPLEYETRRIIADYIDQYNLNSPQSPIRIQNINSIKKLDYYDKIAVTYLCVKNSIGIINTYYRPGISKDVKHEKIQYPSIIKQYAGENDIRNIDGKDTIKKNVYLLNTHEDLNQEYLKDKNLDEYILQEFIQSGEDFRVFVSRGTALAGFSRRATKNFITVSSGEYSKVDLNERNDLKTFAEKVAKVFEADFMAVDMMMKDGQPVLQEISFNPGLKAFETKTDGEFINMAKVILESI